MAWISFDGGYERQWQATPQERLEQARADIEAERLRHRRAVTRLDRAALDGAPGPLARLREAPAHEAARGAIDQQTDERHVEPPHEPAGTMLPDPPYRAEQETTMAIRKISSKGTQACPTGEVALATGQAMAMRMWQDEEPHDKAPHKSPYETLGYVIAGRAELTIEGETVTLEPGDSWLVPKDTLHVYRILETFSAVECTAPPAVAAKA